MIETIRYIVKKGDTLSQISKRFYGTAEKYMKIFEASSFRSNNPNLIYPDEIAYIPQESISNGQEIFLKDVDENEIVMRINNEVIYGFQTASLNLSMINFADSFSFAFPISLSTFISPFKYESVEIYIGQELILTGHIAKCSMTTTETQATINVEGRSKIGLALNSSVSTPKEYKNQKLSAIAKEILGRYSIKVIIEEDVVIPTAHTTIAEHIYQFFQDFIIENGLLLYSLPNGDVILTSIEKTKQVEQTLELGDGMVRSINTSYNGDELYSQYIMKSQIRGKNIKDNIVNNRHINIYRPSVFINRGVIDIQVANKTRYLNSFALAISINITLVGWRKKNGELWRKNEYVIIYSPLNNVNKETKFLIREVSFSISSGKQITALDLTIPQAYTKNGDGDIDDSYIFWDDIENREKYIQDGDFF
jgi:prophage tail gpP-like protein